MNSPSFNGANRLNCFKVEDQQKNHNFSGSLQRLNKMQQLNQNQDMSSVSQLMCTSNHPTILDNCD